MHELQKRETSTIEVLADATELHPNTVREHLARLIEADLVRSEPEVRTTRGRPRIRYRATTSNDVHNDPVAARVLEQSIAQAALSEALIRGFGDETAVGRAESAGRAVGQSLPLAEVPEDSDRELLALSAHLDAFGFDPELDRDELTYHLWRCPFKVMAKERPEVVCSVHSGLAQGILDQAGGRYQVEALTPFVGPEHCTLQVAAKSSGPTVD